MQVVNRRVVDGTESTVDLADQLVDAGSQVLVLFHILPGRDGKLDENDLISATSDSMMVRLTFSTHSGF
jgi:hypothetical protein